MGSSHVALEHPISFDGKHILARKWPLVLLESKEHKGGNTSSGNRAMNNYYIHLRGRGHSSPGYEVISSRRPFHPTRQTHIIGNQTQPDAPASRLRPQTALPYPIRERHRGHLPPTGFPLFFHVK